MKIERDIIINEIIRRKNSYSKILNEYEKDIHLNIEEGNRYKAGLINEQRLLIKQRLYEITELERFIYNNEEAK